MGVFLLVARLLLAALLGVAGVAKLLDRNGSRRSLVGFGLPRWLARCLALVLPLAELVTAAALVPNAAARWGALAALVLFGAFAAVISVALIRGRQPDCHCFGRLHSAPAGLPTIARNVGLAALAGAVVWLDPREGALTGGESSLVLVAAAVVAVLAVQGWLWFQLLRQNGRILARLTEVEQASQPAQKGTTLVGAPAAAFDLPTANGSRVTLAGLLARGRPVMLVFGHAGCGPCQELLPQLSSWQHARKSGLTVALLGEGRFETSPTLWNVAVQVEREVADAYGVTATPAAILVDPDGTLASPLVVGADAIAALVPTPAARPESAERDLRLPLGLAAAGTVLATAGPAAARASRTERDLAAAIDPELLGLRVVIKLANPRLAVDAREVHRALLGLAQPKQPAAARFAAQAALRRERAHVLALRSSLAAVPTSGERPREAKQLAMQSLALLAGGLHQFSRAVASRSASDSTRQLKQAAKPLRQARSLGYAANIVLGCTGKDC